MNVKLVSIALTAATLIAVGCSAQSDDDGAEGADGALSAGDCTPKADSEKATALAACQTANKFDLAGCEKPPTDTFAKWQSDVNTAYAAVRGQIDPITGGCKNDVDELGCKDLLTAAGKDFAAAAGDQKACDALRTTRKAKCDSDAAAAIQDALGGDTTYNALVAQGPQVEVTYLTAIASCDAQSALKTVAAATCPAQAELKRASAYLACRRQCPTLSDAPCTPSDYQGISVLCGKATTVSSALGVLCESNTQCARTALCDKYDTAKADADKLNASSGCTTSAGVQGVLVPMLTTPGNVDGGAPSGVTTICQGPASTTTTPTPAPTSQDAGAPPAIQDASAD